MDASHSLLAVERFVVDIVTCIRSIQRNWMMVIFGSTCTKKNLMNICITDVFPLNIVHTYCCFSSCPWLKCVGHPRENYVSVVNLSSTPLDYKVYLLKQASPLESVWYFYF